MKVKLYLLFTALLLSQGTKGDSIPNNGFERWMNTTWFENPDLWNTNNSQLLPPCVVRDTDAYADTSAMMLVHTAISPQTWCRFQVINHPINLGGYLKNHLAQNDSAVVVVRVFYNQSLVDSGFAVFYGGFNPLWSSFHVPISNSALYADSVEISITGGSVYQSAISFDNLELNFSVGLPQPGENDFNFYPNPCKDYVILNIHSDEIKGNTVMAFNANGQFVSVPVNIALENSECYLVTEKMKRVILNTSVLSPGLWMIGNGEKRKPLKLIRQ
jgi:hypothetical protein